MQIKKIKFQNPLTFAEKIAQNYKQKDWVFLYSALNNDVKNSISTIALFPKNQIIENDFNKAKNSIKKIGGKWFGYLSYELGNSFEKLPKTKKSFINLPKINLINFAVIFEFHHDKKELIALFEDEKLLNKVLNWQKKKELIFDFKVKNLDSNFSDNSYLKEINAIKQMIARGVFYQMNLTRKFFGKFNKNFKSEESFFLFKKLAKTSPANYASFLKLRDVCVISSSPELFLNFRNNQIISRPIKGTTPRSSSKKVDLENKNFLKNSAKERAENLMIVDLVRNDLARICKAGSVSVKKLFEITSYKTIHHMSSEISGKIDKKFDLFDVINACFPAGSMTGAPKIKAMEIIAKKEKLNRGIYSGGIGFIDHDKEELNLSVVIRTLLVQKNNFEFQVGGGITYDSDAKSELLETFSKAKAIINLLESQTKIRK